MTDNPQKRFERDLELDPSVEGPAREGLTGTARAADFGSADERDEITVAPDGRPMEDQPAWRRDFSIDWPRDNFVARRDFTRFLVLTSGAFAVGQGWIAAHSLIRSRRPAPARKRIAARSEIPLNSATQFSYPGDRDPCLLIRTSDDQLVAFSQNCTHLSCAVVPRLDQGVLHCPCHEGYFDLRTGRNIAGPPPRPLPRIEIEIDGDDIYAVGVTPRTA